MIEVFILTPPLQSLYYLLTIGIVGLLWCVGAVGFWKAEAKSQGLSYFQALYFCYVSLLTIGYGDLSPQSNAGKPFFILWSLVAVPTMTILITDMGNTVIASFRRGTFTLADWTVLPKAGVWRTFLEQHPWLLQWLQKKADEAEKRAQDAATNKRITEGFRTGPADEDLTAPPPTVDEILISDEHTLGRHLALAIRRTANDVRTGDSPRRYSYEEWVEFTRLIRFTRLSTLEMEAAEVEEGLVEWDWIGENSPMLADESESEWVLNRLCESLDRYMIRYLSKHGAGHDHKHEHGHGHGHGRGLKNVNGSGSGNEHRKPKRRRTG
jgi:potassium channel subfamily K, other eukaryote